MRCNHKFDLQLLSQCDSMCDCLSRCVPEIHWHVARMFSKTNQQQQYPCCVDCVVTYRNKEAGVATGVMTGAKLRGANQLASAGILAQRTFTLGQFPTFRYFV